MLLNHQENVTCKCTICLKQNALSTTAANHVFVGSKRAAYDHNPTVCWLAMQI
jgi:hypothetical protein